MKSLNKERSSHRYWQALWRWFDTELDTQQQGNRQSQHPSQPQTEAPTIDWVRLIPFILMHLGCFAVLIVGVSATAIWVCVGLYFIRMFSITAFYHRYFSHRAFKTNRFWQFVFAVLGNTATQRGPLWWAGHHRHHHLKSDADGDLHSPVQRGFWWSHMGWFSCNQAFDTPWHRIKDFAAFPELRFLNRFDTVVPLLMTLALYVVGEYLNARRPDLKTSGLQLFVWGACISTVLVFHATATINSLCHLWGNRRFSTKDQSRNNALLALITLGEGWHNNHHRWPISARQGFYWWQLDCCYLLLKCLAWLGIIWDLKPIPEHIRKEGRKVNSRRLS